MLPRPMRDVIEALYEYKQLSAETCEALTQKSGDFKGEVENKRFATWHEAWGVLSLSERVDLLTCIAGHDSEDGDGEARLERLSLTRGEVHAMTWDVPPSVGVHPDGVLTVGNRIWAVLEYKIGAATNFPRRRSVSGVEDSCSLRGDVDVAVDQASYRWCDGPLRVSQLVGYYHARRRLFPAPGPVTDDDTLWRVIADPTWPQRNKTFGRLPRGLELMPGISRSNDDRTDAEVAERPLREIPDIWRHVSLEGPLKVFLKALDDREPERSSKAWAALLTAIAAIHAPGVRRLWKSRKVGGAAGPTTLKPDAHLVNECGMWDGCIESVWFDDYAGVAASYEVRLTPRMGYVLFDRASQKRVSSDIEWPEAITATFVDAGQRPSGTQCLFERCGHFGKRRGCDCIDYVGSKRRVLADRRAQLAAERCATLLAPGLDLLSSS